MKYRKEPGETLYLGHTGVENIFIHEYMVSAPGDYVKAYLIALMYAEANQEIDDAALARMLGLAESEIEKAWKYWETLGVVQRNKEDLLLLSLRERLYGRKPADERKKPTGKPSDVLLDKALKGLLLSVERTVGRPLSGTETREIISWMDDFGASPEVIAYAYAYCVAKKKDNVRYVARIVKDWTSAGLVTVTEVEKHLADNDQRHYAYKRIMQALGFFRNPTEEEKRIIDAWFDHLGWGMEEILGACSKTSGISNPNINYVNTVLQRKKTSGGTVGQGENRGFPTVSEYYGFLREQAATEADKRRALAVSKIPLLAKLEEAQRKCSVELSRLMVSGGPDREAGVEQIKDKAEDLSKKKAALLTEYGFPADYLDTKYKCPLCRDTGTKDSGEQCECYLPRTKEAKEWDKTS